VRSHSPEPARRLSAACTGPCMESCTPRRCAYFARRSCMTRRRCRCGAKPARHASVRWRRPTRASALAPPKPSRASSASRAGCCRGPAGLRLSGEAEARAEAKHCRAQGDDALPQDLDLTFELLAALQLAPPGSRFADDGVGPSEAMRGRDGGGRRVADRLPTRARSSTALPATRSREPPCGPIPPTRGDAFLSGGNSESRLPPREECGWRSRRHYFGVLWRLNRNQLGVLGRVY